MKRKGKERKKEKKNENGDPRFCGSTGGPLGNEAWIWNLDDHEKCKPI
jgi:acyl-coenzyme A synthetase/AMP-(fatty) acid ligase